MPDPVAWTVVEPGWRVVASDGEEVGHVHEVVGDAGIDIFNGLAVSPGVLRGSRYVPAEQVAEIVEGQVGLGIPSDAFDSLEEWHGTPPHERIDSGTTDL